MQWQYTIYTKHNKEIGLINKSSTIDQSDLTGILTEELNYFEQN